MCLCTALNLLIFVFIVGVVTEKCLTPNNERGECIPLYKCSQLANGLQFNPIGHIEFVRKSKCGGSPYDPYVCCGTANNYTQWEDLADRFNVDESTEQTVPKISLVNQFIHYEFDVYEQSDDEADSRIFTVQVFYEGIEEKCITLYGAEGTCTPLYTCPPLLKAFANPLKGLRDDYAKYRCRNTDTYICCEHGWYATAPLSDRTTCGLQRIDDYLPVANSSRTTTIDEFPWLAAIIVPKLDNRIVCQGVLINYRYILTAMQCFISPEYKPEDITAVRLGGYHLKNTTYCGDFSQYNATDCATTEEFGVEERIMHDFYYGKVGLNDIALIRLDRNVSFTDFIRPICLPIPGTIFAKRGDTMYVTGWSKTSEKGARDQVKKKILTTLIDSSACEERLKTTPVRITPLKMCTIDSPLNKEFTCSGDVGAPVMFARKNQWHIEGISSKSWPCGRGYPEVKTKVSQYLGWIRQNIRL